MLLPLGIGFGIIDTQLIGPVSQSSLSGKSNSEITCSEMQIAFFNSADEFYILFVNSSKIFTFFTLVCCFYRKISLTPPPLSFSPGQAILILISPNQISTPKSCQ